MRRGSYIVFRLLPVLLLVIACAFYFGSVEGRSGYVLRNTLPLLAVLALCAVTLVRGGGLWTGAGWQWPLATAGFALPALGLSAYIHYGYSIDLHGMFSESVYPKEVFRFLPYYTTISGGIGFAIGWIAGRNV